MITSHKPCGKCGATDRNDSGKCRPCQRERSARWSAENADKERKRKAAEYQSKRETVRARSADWYYSNKDRAAASARVRYLRDPAKKAQAARAWIKANPARAKQLWAKRWANRRARLNAGGHALSKGIVAKLLKLQRGKCACCRMPLGADYHLDHIQPLALGGANADWNVQLLRNKCNLSKSARHPIAFMQSKGFLL